MMFCSRRTWCFLATAISLRDVFGQLIAQTVMVGTNGSFFEPETISAGLNDIVRFVFIGPSHSVVQASFDTPCFQLTGGFSSGVAGVTNTSVTPPVWDLTVTNVTAPIWFYCANTLPVPHCTSGMVGAINPPSIPLFEDFKSAAKNVSVLPTAFPTSALSGQGAAATAFPTATASSTSMSSSSTASSTQSSTPTPTPASSSNRGAIIGGSVGGALAVVAAAMLLAWFCFTRRGSKQRPTSDKFFDYNAQSPNISRNFNDIYVSPAVMPRAEPFRDIPVVTQPSQSNLSDTMSNPSTRHREPGGVGRTYRVTNEEPPSINHTRSASRALPPTPGSSGMTEQKSMSSFQPSTAASKQGAPTSDIHVLAREVAAVMMQNTLGTGVDRRPRLDSEGEPVSSAPPSYVVHH